MIDELHERGSLRTDVDAVQVCRLVGGVATVADNSALDITLVRPLLEVVADGLLRLTRPSSHSPDSAARRGALRATMRPADRATKGQG